MFNFLLEEAATQPTGNSWVMYVVLIGLVLVMLIVPSFSNKKRQKEYNDMIDSLSAGDTVRTVGGIIGRIVKINDKDGFKTNILETGAKNSKTTMEFDVASIYTVLNSKKQAAAAVKAEVKEEEPAKEVAEEKNEAAEEKVEEVKAEEPKKAKTTKKAKSKKAE